RWRRYLDVLSLGRDIVVNLGVAHGRVVLGIMAVVAIMVSVATVLVGPTLFFGLLIANLAYWITGTQRHRWTLPASVLAGIICLSVARYCWSSCWPQPCRWHWSS